MSMEGLNFLDDVIITHPIVISIGKGFDLGLGVSETSDVLIDAIALCYRQSSLFLGLS